MSLALCDNEKCEAYKNKSCRRAVKYQKIIEDGVWKGYKNMKVNVGNTKMCELFIPVDLGTTSLHKEI